MRKHLVAVLTGAVVSMAALISAPASAALDEMTTEEAGQAYLAAACKDIEATREFSRKVWRGRNRISLAEVRVRLPQVKSLARVYGRALNKSSRMLFNPEAGTWPASVSSDVARVAKTTANESYWRMRQGSAANANAWLRFNGRGNKAAEASGTAPTRIRATLNLPPPGEGC